MKKDNIIQQKSYAFAIRIVNLYRHLICSFYAIAYGNKYSNSLHYFIFCIFNFQKTLKMTYAKADGYKIRNQSG